MKSTSMILLTAAVVTLLLPSHLLAATAAYWRHEEGPVGGLIPDGPDTVLDSSGNGNHMQVFDSATTSATYTETVSPLDLRSGLPNTLALDFGPGGDDPGLNDDNFTQSKLIQTQLFTEMTIELAFKMDSIGGFQALFGKDGKPLGDEVGEDDSPVPPLKVMVRGDDFPNAVPNQLFVEWIDGDGVTTDNIHFLSTGETVVPDQWYHVAFTLTGTDAELWVAGETGDYVLKDAISGEDFAGTEGEVWVFDPTPVTIGRGMFNNGVTDWADAVIDEVRVSDAALTPEEFLFVTVPAAAENADFDGDSDVDGADFLIWQRNVGAAGTGTAATGDANADTLVDGADLAVWKAQFGDGGAAQAIPEPSTLALGLAAATAAAFVVIREIRVIRG